MIYRYLYRPRHRQGSPAWLILGVLFLSVVLSAGLAKMTAPTTVKPVPLTAISKPQAEQQIARPGSSCAKQSAGRESHREQGSDIRQREVRRATRAKPRPRVPTLDELIYRPQGRQSFFKLKDNQRYNATVIIRTGRKMGLPYRALVIAIGTSLQESHLNNYGNLGARNDHDSLGLFQQRPSTGWGKPSQIMNPVYSSTAFYKSLLKVRGWHSLPLTVAAQRVQGSAFPFAYAKWERMAAQIVRGYFQ